MSNTAEVSVGIGEVLLQKLPNLNGSTTVVALLAQIIVQCKLMECIPAFHIKFLCGALKGSVGFFEIS